VRIGPDARPRGFQTGDGSVPHGVPGLTIAVEDIVGEGDKVATRGSFSGTYTGDFMGIPATGKPMRISYSDIWRIKNGKAAENWVQRDTLGMLQQLGVAPSQ
jgi:predicted ester cyclase